VKLVHLVVFITKKFVTMHGHMNVKRSTFSPLQICKIWGMTYILGVVCILHYNDAYCKFTVTILRCVLFFGIEINCTSDADFIQQKLLEFF